MKQRTPEWYAARVGKVTASRIGDVVGRTKAGKYRAERKNYMAELLAERLSGAPYEFFVSAEMEHGTELEPLARSEYEFTTDTVVEEVGFAPHPTIEMSGASPDGLVGTDGLIEIKCPKTATHIQTLLSKSVENQGYLYQMYWQMRCTQRSWCDFVSYDDRLPEEYRKVIVRVEADSRLIDEAEAEVVKFLDELDYLILEVQEAVGG